MPPPFQRTAQPWPSSRVGLPPLGRASAIGRQPADALITSSIRAPGRRQTPMANGQRRRRLVRRREHREHGRRGVRRRGPNWLAQRPAGAARGQRRLRRVRRGLARRGGMTLAAATEPHSGTSPARRESSPCCCSPRAWCWASSSTVRWRSVAGPGSPSSRLHRNLTLLAIAFVALHVADDDRRRLRADRAQGRRVPFVAAYRPLWLGLGAVAFDLLLALVVTSLLRARIGYRAWRAVHWLAYASWPFALVHGLGTGSDRGSAGCVLITIVCAGAVGAALAARLLRSPARYLCVRESERRQSSARCWPWSGTKAGRGSRAGPHGQAPGVHPHAATPLPRRAPHAAKLSTRLPTSFDGRLSGSIRAFERHRGDVGVAFGAAVRGRVPAILRLTLWGTEPTEGISMSDSRVTSRPSCPAATRARSSRSKATRSPPT